MAATTAQPIQDAVWEQIFVPSMPAPSWRYLATTAPEVFDLRPDWPFSIVEDYPELGRTLDPYAYGWPDGPIKWDFPQEVFAIPGVVHTRFEDAHAASSLPGGEVLNLKAPLPAMANVAGYGL